jgi:hypothetical protein
VSKKKYTDDVTIFFGHASSMITNLQKCVVYPIACDPSSLVDLLDGITCEFKAFPCKHLVRL